jgi:hypothetical protein
VWGQAGATGVVAVLAGWAALGFAGLTSYPSLLARLTSVEEKRAFSLTALGHSLGFPDSAGRAATVFAGLVSLTAIFMLARRDEGDRRAFSMAVAGSLLLSPIVWLHYFVILVVPIAIVRRRMSKLWLLPAALPLPPIVNAFVILWAIAVTAAVFAIVLKRQVPRQSGSGVAVRALVPAE